MGDGINVSKGVTSPAPIQDADPIPAETLPSEPKADSERPDPRPKKPPVVFQREKMEQRLNGKAREIELRNQLENKSPVDTLDAAEAILENPKLSNEAKVAELQKMIGKTDQAQFKRLLSYPHFSDDQKQLINSAITESPRIMERIATELPQQEQLRIVSDAVMNPLRGKSPKEEQKRLERSDRALSGWMNSTDPDTLRKALNGKDVSYHASARLYGALASNPAQVIRMGDSARLLPDQLRIAMEVVQGAHMEKMGRKATREDIENLAGSLIIQEHEREKSPNVRSNKRV